MSYASLSRTPWHLDSGLAVVGDGVHWDYEELHRRVLQREAELRLLGLAAGQVVMVAETPAVDLLLMQHALARLGAGLFPVSAGRGASRARESIRAAGVEWRWKSDTTGRDSLVPTGLSSARGDGGACPTLIVQTSGSGGAPKAVMLTPGNVLVSAALINARLDLGRGDRWLACLPRSHVGGLMIGYRCALAGAAVLLHERFDAAALARDLERHPVTHLSLVPPMLGRLLEVAERPPPSLRTLLVGGQALSGPLAKRAIEAGWPLRVTYGMTETASAVAISEVLSATPATGLAGPILPGVRVRCDGTATSPAAVAVGGPVVMAGYGNAERAPGDGLADGWFATEDLGYFADAGDLVVLGRADGVLKIGGEAVVTARIEDEIACAPGVESAAVVAVEDPVWGHRLILAYAGAIGPQALAAWCRQHLSRRECPRGFRRLTRMPLLASGKLDRNRIRGLVSRAPGDGSGYGAQCAGGPARAPVEPDEGQREQGP